MSKRRIAVVAADFAEVLQFLQERGIVPSHPTAELVRVARKIHGYTYSLILWRFRLNRIPKHGSVFLEEIASDALQILPQIAMGYSKTAKLLTRGIIENALRHLYFIDHPIEFERMNREAKWFLTVEALLEYGKNHPVFLKTERHFSVFGQVSSLYSDLSAGIHGRTVRDLEMKVALRRITYEAGAAEAESELIKRCAEATNFLLAMLHRNSMATFKNEDQRVILRSLSTRARQLWREHE